MILMLIIPSVVYAGTSVKFQDKILEKEVRNVLHKSKGVITSADMAKITELKIPSGVKSLKGLSYAVNLEMLWLTNSSLTNLSEIKNLKKLETLIINQNSQYKITDIDNTLSNLTNIKQLYLKNVSIKSETLSKLKKVFIYELENNGLTDINFMKSNEVKSGMIITIIGNQIRDFTPMSGKKIERLTIEKDNVLDIKTLQGLNGVFDEFGRIYLKYCNIINCDVIIDWFPDTEHLTISGAKEIRPVNKFKVDSLGLDRNNKSIKYKNILLNALSPIEIGTKCFNIDDYKELKDIDIPRHAGLFFSTFNEDEFNKALYIMNDLYDNEDFDSITIWPYSLDLGKIDKKIYAELYDKVMRTNRSTENYQYLRHIIGILDYVSAKINFTECFVYNGKTLLTGYKTDYDFTEYKDGFNLYDLNYKLIKKQSNFDFVFDDEIIKHFNIMHYDYIKNEYDDKPQLISYLMADTLLTRDCKYIISYYIKDSSYKDPDGILAIEIDKLKISLKK